MNKIFMIGDSTMQYNNIFSYPQTGWGQVLHLFTKNNWLIEDHAKNGRSTKSFIDEGRFKNVLDKLSQGDYVICQFGHNDEKDNDLTRYTDKDTSYLDNLAYFHDEFEKKGAHIVYATSITRRKFQNGKCIDTHKGYPQSMKKWCDKNHYTCIDLNQLTLALYNELGEENTKKFHMIFGPKKFENYPEGKEDNSHLVYDGAIMISKLFVEEILKTNDSIKECFLNLNQKEEIDERMLKD